MAKEAQEKIAIRLHSTERSLLRVVNEGSPCNCMWDDLADEWKEHYRQNANWFLSDVIQLGYRKLPKDKPPLLSDEVLSGHWHKWADEDRAYPTAHLMLKAVAQAQREADIKHYED